MSVQSELQSAARAIRAQQPPDATFHQAVAALLDQIALTTPASVIETQASPIVRLGLDVARAYMRPSQRVDLSHPPLAPGGCDLCGAPPGGRHEWSCEQVPAETFKQALAAASGGGL